MGQLLWGLTKALFCLIALAAMLAVMVFQAGLIVLWWIVGALAGLGALAFEWSQASLAARREQKDQRLLSQYLRTRAEMDRVQQERSLSLLEKLHRLLASGASGSGDWGSASPPTSQGSSVRGGQTVAGQRSATTARQRLARSSQERTYPKS